jgi:hypothetical protein
LASFREELLNYFSLYGPSPVLGGTAGSENKRQLKLFAGVALGAVCKVIYDAFTSAGNLGWKVFVVALIASLVVFPQLYYSGGLNRKKLTFAHWALAFQNGFFWSIALSQLSKHLGG